jgi:hypothetical protein
MQNWAALTYRGFGPVLLGAAHVEVSGVSPSKEKRLREVMDRARELARSGKHASHSSIEAELRTEPDFSRAERWFRDRRFCAQLDRLCAESQTFGRHPRRRDKPTQ